MTFKLGPASRSKLIGVHPDLVRVVERAITLTTVDFRVLCGLRTVEEQRELYARGRTKPGPKVTWTLASKHLKQPDGFGHAVDLVPWPTDWNTVAKFDAIADAMFAAAKELRVKIRWGRDWDRDGIPDEKGETDGPHFELAEAK